MIVGQQSNYFCKICKKGFGCGRALGGHMRAHGIGDESGQIDDDDPPSDWEDKIDGGSNVPSTNKYGLRTNPNRSKTTRNCANCGKVFFSWKAFFEHGKCSSSVDEESLVSSSPDYEDDRRGCGGWSKRKRSLRAKVGGTSGNSLCPSSEEEDLANCLMMLSNATVDPMEAEPEESCASASKEEERIRNPFMSPISRGMAVDHSNKPKGVSNSNNNKGLFECKACKKVFNSHQALGGHRASHKKVKGCFAARLDHLEDSMADDDIINQEEFFPSKPNSNFQFDHGSNVAGSSAYSSKRKSKVHECSICHRIFSSGQALGGHKRCHWITSNAAPDTSTLAKFHEFQESIEQQMMNHQMAKFDTSASDPLDLKLDLNLPAPTTDENGGGRRDRLITNSKASGLDVSTEFFLQSWVGTKEEDNPHLLHSHNQIENDNNIISNDDYNVNNKNNNSSGSMHNVTDEADSKLKLAKLSELKDINTSGTSSPWLQVGLSSTTNVAADP